MNSDNTHLPYVKSATFTTETTIEEMRQLYSDWSRTYEKVSINDYNDIIKSCRCSGDLTSSE